MKIFGIIYIVAEVAMLLTTLIGNSVDSSVAIMVGFIGLASVLTIGMIICIGLDTWVRAIFPVCFVPLRFTFGILGNDSGGAFLHILIMILLPVMFSVSVAALALGLVVALLGSGITLPIVAFTDY